MEKEELLLRLSMLEQRGNQIGEQAQAVEKKIIELEILKNNLDKLEGKEKDILAHIGEGIFIKSEIKDKEVFVNIGNKVVVKKKIPEAKNIIDEQITRLEELKIELENEIEKINIEFKKIVDVAEKEKSS